MSLEIDSQIGLAQAICGRAHQREADHFMARRSYGLPIDRFPRFDAGWTASRSSEASTTLSEIGELDLACLPADLELTTRAVQFEEAYAAGEEERCHVLCAAFGFPALTIVSGYSGLGQIKLALSILAQEPVASPVDRDRYVFLLSDLGRYLDEVADHVERQANEGVRTPRPALTSVQSGLAGLVETITEALTPPEGKLAPLSADARENFSSAVAERIDANLIPAVQRLQAIFDGDYQRAAPDGVGLEQFRGGAQAYEDSVRYNVGLDLSPEEVHRRGLELCTELAEKMAALRATLGFNCDEAEFRAHLAQDPRWREHDLAGLQARCDQYVERITARLPEMFSFRPSGSGKVAALDPALETSMTFGYYQPPEGPAAVGTYYYNAKNTLAEPLHGLASLIYHELLPGHHLHLASQMENRRLHPFRRGYFPNAFNEAWAEYGATLAGELGLYEHPVEQYGRYAMERFLAARLVVDTGLNALGWTLAEARAFLRRNCDLSDAQIWSEVLRYSCAIPGQALAYKLGEISIRGMREKARAKLRERFDLREFHDAVLKPGALPISLLEWNLERWIDAKGDEAQ